MRAALSVALMLSVPVGALWAPLVHAHPARDADHHDAPLVHAHVAGHVRGATPHDHPALDEPEHAGAVYVQAYVAVQVSLFESPAAPAPVFELPSTQERPPHVAVEVTHGHDPPLPADLDSRPPPPFVLS